MSTERVQYNSSRFCQNKANFSSRFYQINTTFSSRFYQKRQRFLVYLKENIYFCTSIITKNKDVCI